MNVSPQGQFCLGKQNQGISARVKTSLAYLGFDFSNLGAKYLQEIILEVLKTPKLIHSLVTDVYQRVADKYDANIHSVERVTRLAIIKAHAYGRVGQISYFNKNKAPTIKQMVNFMYDYFMEFDYMI